MQNKHLRLCVLCGLLFAGFALGSAHGTTNDRRIELRDSILHHITGATLPTKTIVITSLGAKADGKSDCLRAFRKAFKQAQKQGGARIVVPRGTYFLRGPLHLVSNLCLELQEGATLKFTPDPKCYPLVNTSWEGTFLYNYSPFIYGYGLHDVTITGKGTIDGNAMTTFATWRSKQKKGQEQSRYMNNEGLHLELRKFYEQKYKPLLYSYLHTRLNPQETKQEQKFKDVFFCFSHLFLLLLPFPFVSRNSFWQ
ncbi:MAG: glycosyl hydrolase family 28-related protein [Prevotella sp.]|nr:glycosyl hydrolase family 28-related protein [Prevotella sp.]